MTDDPKAPGDDIAGLIHLLRALATGTDHIASKHDVVFTAAADALERLAAAPWPPCMAPDGGEACVQYQLASARVAELEADNAKLRERLGPHGLVVVQINGTGHYVNEAVAARIAALEADIDELEAEAATLGTSAIAADEYRERCEAIRAQTIAECEAAIDGFTRDEFGSVYADDVLEAFAELRGTSSKPEAPPISELKVTMLGGNCPVQAEGTIAGVPFYFRARGEHWSFGVGEDPIGAPTWERSETWGDEPFAAGWMPEAEARQIIARCAAEFLKEKGNG